MFQRGYLARWRVIAIAGLGYSLCACGVKESEAAERDLQMLQQSGTPEQVCAAKRKLADAYLHENNQDKFPLANIDADMCDQALKLRGF